SVEERDDVAAVADQNVSGPDRSWAERLCPVGLNGGRRAENFDLEWTRWCVAGGRERQRKGAGSSRARKSPDPMLGGGSS
ncbi:hypothetical protein THAOC_01131, partial [Thalassiosira oceanica]